MADVNSQVVAPSGERYEVKAGMVCLQCKKAVWCMPKRFRGGLLRWGAIQISMPLKEVNYRVRLKKTYHD